MTVTAIFISLVGLIGVGMSCANYIIEFESFSVGQCVEADYTAPTTGRTTVHLKAACDTVVLAVDYRKLWVSNPYTGQLWQNIVTLNSRIGGAWGDAQHVENITTTPGMEMAWRICARDADFSIVLNYVELTTYPYRVPIATVRRVQFIDRGYDSVLQNLSLVDSSQVQTQGQLTTIITTKSWLVLTL